MNHSVSAPVCIAPDPTGAGCADPAETLPAGSASFINRDGDLTDLPEFGRRASNRFNFFPVVRAAGDGGRTTAVASVDIPPEADASGSGRSVGRPAAPAGCNIVMRHTDIRSGGGSIFTKGS